MVGKVREREREELSHGKRKRSLLSTMPEPLQGAKVLIRHGEHFRVSSLVGGDFMVSDVR